jgi:hypothetical protein
MAENPMTGLPMASMTDVFGSQKNTPSQIFERSRSENAGVVVNTRSNDMALACPSCRSAGNASVRLFANQAGFYCVAGHQWKDLDVLMALAPEKLAYVGIQAKQDGWSKYTLDMPESILRDLQTKFGERLGSTLRNLLELLATQKFILVSEEHLKKIKEFSGEDVQNANALQGIIYSLKTTTNEQKAELEALKANPGSAAGGMTPSSVLVELGMLFRKAREKAETMEVPVAEVVRTCVDICLEQNGWV